MVRYRRNRVPGGTFFFTLTLRNRSSDLLVARIDALREAWRSAQARVPHEVVAAVVLPEHLHAVVTMRDAAADYPRLWQDIKKGFTRRVQPGGMPSPWQARYWEHTLRDEDDLRRHVDYVHINPLKHRLVERVADWPHSTFHRYVARGMLPIHWCGGR
jgi:putative transposase